MRTLSQDGNKEMPGIIPRSVKHIFDKIDEIQEQHIEQEFLVCVSYLEIYNEMVHDLLGNEVDHQGKALTLPVKEDAENHAFFVKDLTERVVSSSKEVTDLINEGNGRRSVSATNMNAASSRSHAIVCCHVERQYPKEKVKAPTKMMRRQTVREDSKLQTPKMILRFSGIIYDTNLCIRGVCVLYFSCICVLRRLWISKATSILTKKRAPSPGASSTW
jgi:hypothetical protein